MPSCSFGKPFRPAETIWHIFIDFFVDDIFQVNLAGDIRSGGWQRVNKCGRKSLRQWLPKDCWWRVQCDRTQPISARPKVFRIRDLDCGKNLNGTIEPFGLIAPVGAGFESSYSVPRASALLKKKTIRPSAPYRLANFVIASSARISRRQNSTNSCGGG